MNNATLSRIAIIAYALVIIVFGVTHFVNTQEMRNFVPAFVPGGGVWVYITGACLIASGLAMIINQKVRLAALLLTVLLLSFALTIHLPRLMNGFDSGVGLIMKDVGLAAGALLIASRNDGR
ncbi:MAG: DoxX family membrane protein [Chitinophagaceae bacterium]